MKVKVTRYSEDDAGGCVYDGVFLSKVYAIDGNRFLVWDSGDCRGVPPGFCWVDFTETMEPLTKQDDPWEPRFREPVVELWEMEGEE